MSTVVEIVTVFLLGVVELWTAIPAGFVFKLNPLVIAVVSAGGAIAATIIVVFLGERLREWLLRRYSRSEKKQGMVQRIWSRFGIPGLGLLSPLLTGAPLGAALGIAFGAPKSRLITWMAIGIVVWSILLTGGGVLGFAGFNALGR